MRVRHFDWPQPSYPFVARLLLDKSGLNMKLAQLRTKDGTELKKELNELLKAQFGLRMQVATQQLANTSQLKKVRRDIARVRTVITQKATDK